MPSKLIVVSVLLVTGAACGSKAIYDPNESAVPTQETEPTGPGPRDSDADTDADADADADADTDTDWEPTWACHPYDPIELDGWQKVFAVNYEGQAGDEWNWGGGGSGTYRVDVSMTAGTGGWAGPVYYACDQGEDGAYVQSWEFSYTNPLMGPVSVLATLSPGRRYLPGFDQMGSIGSWSYSYTLSATTDFGSSSVPTSGVFTEVGFEEISVTAGTFSAYHLQHSYTQDWSAIGYGFGGPGLVDATGDYWYAPGIGLVYEETVDNTTGAMILEKELESYSGLSSP